MKYLFRPQHDTNALRRGHRRHYYFTDSGPPVAISVRCFRSTRPASLIQQSPKQHFKKLALSDSTR